MDRSNETTYTLFSSLLSLLSSFGLSLLLELLGLRWESSERENGIPQAKVPL